MTRLQRFVLGYLKKYPKGVYDYQITNLWAAYTCKKNSTVKGRVKNALEKMVSLGLADKEVYMTEPGLFLSKYKYTAK